MDFQKGVFGADFGGVLLESSHFCSISAGSGDSGLDYPAAALGGVERPR